MKKDNKQLDINDVSKEWLFEQLGAVEDERNKLLSLCEFIVNNRCEMFIPNTIFLNGDDIDTWLFRVTGKRG